jgi:nickel transport system ATP-binding protein
MKVDHLYKSYKKKSGFFKKENSLILKDISLNIFKGECLGLIGESGSGKSTLGRLISGIEESDSGKISINGVNLNRQNSKSFKDEISIVFQDYNSSVNPRFKVIDIILEALKKMKKENKKTAIKKVISLLEKVGLNEDFLDRYPHQLSGGQLQRVCIARAIATNPELIILDEAVSSLDVSTQVEILNLLIKLKEEMDISYLFITHDLMAVTYICDRVIFLKEGEIVEKANSIFGLRKLKEEYSKKLLQASMVMNRRESKENAQKIS